jgi:gamma-glutamylcysteine synthetase
MHIWPKPTVQNYRLIVTTHKQQSEPHQPPDRAHTLRLSTHSYVNTALKQYLHMYYTHINKYISRQSNNIQSGPHLLR